VLGLVGRLAADALADDLAGPVVLRGGQAGSLPSLRANFREISDNLQDRAR
jgi:hypothetical protein